ncbi:MAG: enoyl-CoA hydratase/isomerase family protein [Bdellovibrionales bacterium]|nr:enoyl-CoA hydratase/isomerase family protein [Bdellovibrionales bacterium]
MSLLTVKDEAHGLRVVTLNRPEKLNALSRALVDELIALNKKIHDDAQNHRIRSVAFNSSSEKAFCVGADLSERMRMNNVQVAEILAKQRELMDGISGLPVPTFAVLEGAAFGGGFELALACDLRVCSPQATMGLTETRLAIIPGAGGTQRLSRLVGPTKAKEMIYLAQRVNGKLAAEWGLVSRCQEKPLQFVFDCARDVSLAGPVAIAAAKQAIDEGCSLPLAQALDVERKCYERVIPTEDRLEGLAAFSEKRPPIYKGK